MDPIISSCWSLCRGGSTVLMALNFVRNGLGEKLGPERVLGKALKMHASFCVQA
jgi:hypothetical protein